ncbi:hypothetical protein SH139x_003529 [Planctomycetaceae bacterium SH139]
MRRDNRNGKIWLQSWASRWLLLVSLCGGGAIASGQNVAYERPPIDYLNAPVSDRVAELAAAVEAGSVVLEFDPEHGYLPSVLAALEVPQSSQTLVFSKTSLQLHRISPRQPRALYFNDEVYVGWCQRGDVLELAATDAQQGAIFYTLEQTETGTPEFLRDRGQCLTCHASSRTQDVPGYLMRSVYADSAGRPVLGSGTYTTDDTSPLDERWGGWYVTGTHGSMRHLGNLTTARRDRNVDLESGANQLSLGEQFDVAKYLTPHSDIVALMVLGHQTQMHNAIAHANYEARQAWHHNREMNRLLEREPGSISESTERRLTAAATRVVRQLLMCDEYALTSAVVGTSQFAEEFQQRGQRDRHGRSLRDLDLKTRLFRYPCSFLIGSAAFKGLPEQVKQRVIERLAAILTGQDQSAEYEHLTPQDRGQLLEILGELHPDLGLPTA